MNLPNKWEFPGGKVEKNESLSEAIVREIKEELKCSIECKELFNDNVYLKIGDTPSAKYLRN